MSDILYDTLLRELARDEQFRADNPIHFYGDSVYAALIIDPRYDELMEGVIRNFMYFMNPQRWNLCIASYRGHEAAIRAAFPSCVFISIPDELIDMNEKGEPNISIQNYNRVLMNTALYDTIPATHLAIFQKDCVMYNMFPRYFADSYGFAGANYYKPLTPIYGGINGGFSLRNTDNMKACIGNVSTQQIMDTFPDMKIMDGKCEYEINEDVFFTSACEILKIPVPDKIHRAYLAIESEPWENTCVHHGWNKLYHSKEMAVRILGRSPLWAKYLDPVLNRLEAAKQT